MLQGRYINLVIFLFLYGFCIAQELPPVEIYTPQDYQADNQNWSISQSDNKFIYVANNKGLLEFNGSKWRLYPSPNETIMRSVNVIDNIIYTGSYREFGTWQRNEFGLLHYTSLSTFLNIEFLDDEEIWNIIGLNDYILFQSLKRIYIYNKINLSYTVINSDTTIHKMFKVDQSIYFQKDKDGVYKVENGKPLLISDHEVFSRNVLVNIFHHNGALLLETENDGFYTLNHGLKRWEIPANDILSNISVYRSIQLKDNSFVLGTISHGILHLSAEGELNYIIDNVRGLSNNTVHSVFEDLENNIWIGLENGINCINVKSPLRIYNDEKGILGTVNASAIFNDYLYLGTNQGLFYKALNKNEEFKLIDGTQGAVWCLLKLDNKLFCGHNYGTFIVNKNEIAKVSDIQGTWNIIAIKGEKDKLLQGNYDGLYVLEKTGAAWGLKNKIDGFEVSSRYFEIVNKTEILVSHEYRGVLKVKVNNNFTKALEVVKDTSVAKGLNSSLIRYKDDILYNYKDGVYKYDSIKGKFVKDTMLNKVFQGDTYSSGKLVSDENNNGLWGFSNKRINYISFGGLSANPIINKIPVSKFLPRSLTGYENVTHLSEQKYLIGTSNGFMVLDLDKIQEKTYEIEIYSIMNSGLKTDEKYLSKLGSNDLENQHNYLKFSYCIAEYEKYLDAEYQYQLEGLNNQWSPWSSSATQVFENLSFGEYTFKVRGKVGDILTSNVAAYNFTISRPWYLSYTMLAVYILFLFVITLLIHNIYKRYYKKQREKLLEKTQRELDLKELENKQQLMQFKNERLEQDIENKNRELAISTMSLIKKNEFLNNIKKELNKVKDSSQNSKRVVKIIDKNINNTDDWKLFEEAFNNADKDFLKRVMSKHDNLTHNDLRLCAYLRLNLSSKEIAPLLNISPRSVEVKRYRLRKKMELPHGSSLTSYILEF